MSNNKPGKSKENGKDQEGILTTYDAAIDSLSKEIDKIRKEQEKQRDESKNIIIGVLVALVLIVVSVAVEVIFYHSSQNNSELDFQKQVDTLNFNVQSLQKDFSTIKR